MKSSCWRWILCGVTCVTTMVATIAGTAAEPLVQKEKSVSKSASVSGREIFLREWLPNDPRSHGGDGLGPVFNDTSCVSCHNQGGIGGGGSEAKNVVVVTAVRTNVNEFNFNSGAFPRATPNSDKKSDLTPKEQERKMLEEELRSIHPGLVTARSVVLHKSGTDPKYAAWRDKALGLNFAAFGVSQPDMPVAVPAPPASVFSSLTVTSGNPNFLPGTVPTPPASSGGGFFAELAAEAQQNALLELQPPQDLMIEKARSLVSRFPAFAGQPVFFGNGAPGQQPQRNLVAIPTQRNSIALFGAGLIDSIPDEVIESAAAKKYEDYPEISGRVAKLKDGKIGRFGWKAQKASLYDFTMTACAVELGLNVPDHPQAGVPQQPDYQPTGFDLNQEECRELVQYLKDLPAPTRSASTIPEIASELQLGEKAFAKIGCAACHVSDMGDVHGIFSDLLVHDLGSDLGDSGSYGVFQPQSPGNDADDPLAGLLSSNAMGPVVSGNMTIPVQGPMTVQGLMAQEEPIPAKMIGTGRQEWRTAPLWGVRDSAPYMHDGRAGSLEQAIANHGGEAQLTANRFFRLPPDEKARVLAFLRSLVAPE